MDVVVHDKMKRILQGELKYTSANLAFNMLISKLQKRVTAEPGSIDTCMTEMDAFLAKYPIVAKVDAANIAAL